MYDHTEVPSDNRCSTVPHSGHRIVVLRAPREGRPFINGHPTLQCQCLAVYIHGPDG
ncbi:unnamed protein product, partial [Staurois parvus]